MSTIDRILQRHLPPAAASAAAAPVPAVPADLIPAEEGENVEDLGGWGLLRGVRDRAVSLELRKRDGAILAIPYALIEQFAYAPGEGITLRAVGREVRIRGRRLNDTSMRPLSLFSALARQRVSWVQEASPHDATLAGTVATVVEAIGW